MIKKLHYEPDAMAQVGKVSEPGLDNDEQVGTDVCS